MTVHQALLHADLHTGSVMVSPTDTRVIDAEFAIYGPLGFDLGSFVGNLLMAYFSQPGHESRPDERAEYGEWLLAQIVEFWGEFVARFSALWSTERTGDGYPSSFFTAPADSQSFAAARQQWFQSLLGETVGYAGAEIIRRIVGFAHNADFGSIENPDLRALCEQRSLAFARELIVTPHDFPTIGAVIDRARRHAQRTA
jgi:5-methylthioribose kinase